VQSISRSLHVQSEDVHAALKFVISRITDEAEHAGTPLSSHEVQFLNHLPRRPTNPTVSLGVSRRITLPTRDHGFERLCALARNAHKHDLDSRANAAREWKFALAVLQLNRHPMAWLLEWAGMKRLKARLDGCLLVSTALVIAALALPIFVLAARIEHSTYVWKSTLVIAGGAALFGMVAALYLMAQRFEQWQLKKIVEESRQAQNRERV
jgi:hypothetical protein